MAGGGEAQRQGALPGKHASWRAEAESWVTGIRKKPLGTFPTEKKEKSVLFLFQGVSPSPCLSPSLSPFLVSLKEKGKKKNPLSCSCSLRK